jgi:hypothetical protein
MDKLVVATFLAVVPAAGRSLNFPPAGEPVEVQQRVTPAGAGLDPAVIAALDGRAKRWALWRDGRLVHVSGDFNETSNVASHRKTWHALTVGAAIQQGKIPSLDQPLSIWNPELKGNDAKATWRHVITQSAGFDYPYGEYPDFLPGQMWTYSDHNPVQLTMALARVYGRKDYHDQYELVVKQTFFDAIGLRGWKIVFTKDKQFAGPDDGVRFLFDLEDMGRLGLLVLARGNWNGKQLIPRWYVEALETKQTRGMKANYKGPNDGMIGLDASMFPEAPYGFMTWVNTDGDYYPGASRAWAAARGAGGHVTLWNHELGIVYAAAGLEENDRANSIARILQSHLITLPAPAAPPVRVGRWERFEAVVRNSKPYKDPYRDVMLNVTYTAPDRTKTEFWGFHDAPGVWKIRFMPDQPGEWSFDAKFSDGAPGMAGKFRVVSSKVRGMISVERDNPVWFGFRGGEHVVVRSLHIGDRFFAENWPGEKRKAFLDWAVKQRYNMLSIASHYLNRDTDGRGRGWKTPALWPLNPAEYARMEAILDDLATRGIMVFPFAGFFGQSSNYPRNPADQELYVRYTLARMGPYWNVVFNVAGPEPNLNKRWMADEEVQRLGRLIRKLDVFAHPLTVHNRTGDDPYRDSEWTSFGTLQGPKTINRKKLSQGVLESHHATKPLYAQETLWPGNKFHKEPYTDTDVRKNSYVLMMAAAAVNFGDMNGDSSSGFSGTLELSDKVQARHDAIQLVWDYMETIPYWRMKPRQDLVDNGYCLAEEGRTYVVYLDAPGTVNVKVRGGPYRIRWVNARKPSDKREAETTTDGRGLQTPAGGDDWLLELRAAK